MIKIEDIAWDYEQCVYHCPCRLGIRFLIILGLGSLILTMSLRMMMILEEDDEDDDDDPFEDAIETLILDD